VLPWKGNNDICFVLSLTYTCRCQECKSYFNLQVKSSVHLSDLKNNCVFLTDSNKCLEYQISCKSVQWEPTNGQTDMTKLIGASRDFGNVHTRISLPVNTTLMCSLQVFLLKESFMKIN
jgi:hypothetical protein